MPNIAAQAYRYNKGLPFSYPKNGLTYSENFLHMMFSTPCEEYKVNKVLAKALDRIFILHADHEQTPPPPPVRLAGSSGANPFACIAAGIACLGPVPRRRQRSRAENAGRNRLGGKRAGLHGRRQAKTHKLMGFGHRVYKNFDPRAKIACEGNLRRGAERTGSARRSEVPAGHEAGRNRPERPYFIERASCTRTWTSTPASCLSAIGIPVSMFTPIFALARTVGWISHWTEMISDPGMKIGRPRQLYTGSVRRDYAQVADRK